MEHQFGKALKHCYVGPGDLLAAEIFWRENYHFLASSGYQLRPRYNPDWIPSWSGTNEWWFSFEDGQIPSWTTVMDARRSSDNALVLLKKINLSRCPREVEILRRFLSKSSADNPENHCVPVYDVLEVPESTDLAILVMPYLLQTHSPDFETLGEIVEYFRQIFEGLYFLHRQGVAHRSIKSSHVLMDAGHLYPEPFHPVFPAYTYDLTGDSKPCSRTEKPVRYYFVDFGRAVAYSSSDLPRDYPLWDGEQTVPEYWLGDMSDPFAGDVYCLGNMVYRLLAGANCRTSPLRGFKFMDSLIRDMTHEDPTRRPTMQEAVLRFTAITTILSSLECRSRLASRDENFVVGLFRSTLHWMRQVRLIWHNVPPIPVA